MNKNHFFTNSIMPKIFSIVQYLYHGLKSRFSNFAQKSVLLPYIRGYLTSSVNATVTLHPGLPYIRGYLTSTVTLHPGLPYIHGHFTSRVTLHPRTFGLPYIQGHFRSTFSRSPYIRGYLRSTVTLHPRLPYIHGLIAN
jgi:hypothetical protein